MKQLKLKHISIRTKLLSVLVATTVIVLLVYAEVSFSSFTRDKVAYVFDSTLSHARATSYLIKTELEKQIEKIQLILRGYDKGKVEFNPQAQAIFNAADDLESLHIYKMDPLSGQPQLLSKISKAAADPFEKSNQTLEQLIQSALLHGVSLIEIQNGLVTWALAVRTVEPVSQQVLITVTTFNRGRFLDVISKGDIQSVYLLGSDDNVVIRPPKPSLQIDERDLRKQFADIDLKAQSSGVKEVSLSNQTQLLMSYAQVGAGGLWVAEIVPRAKAVEAITNLLYTTGKMLLALIGITVFISVLLASGLTTNLNRLHSAVLQVSQGHLDAKVDVVSRDEIGDLSQGFNQMTSEIRRLIEETKEKARMEGELKTARVVQSMLFPQPSATFAKAKINGYYQPASECSGDWWNYYTIGSKIFMAIGDATGHGVPAALVTSAARSASQLVSQTPGITVSKWLETLNQAIYGTLQGEVQMTFFLGCLDQETGIFTFANASHDPPYWFAYQSSEEKLERKDVEPLLGKTGARLGQSPDSQYEEVSIQMKPGQVISFLTDGVIDVMNPEQKTYGDRRLLKNLVGSFNESRDTKRATIALQNELESFRQQTPLKDDVTYFFMEYGG